MKKIVLISFSCLLFLISCNKDTLAQINAPSTINFGSIETNETINKEIKISNTSPNELVIKRIKSSCGCTITEIKDSIIQSNENTTLKIQFKADSHPGKVKKSIVIEANTKPNFTVLYLIGNVVSP